MTSTLPLSPEDAPDLDNFPEYTGDNHVEPCPLPVLHLNGTGRATLLAQYQAAEEALDAFCVALARATLHPRDYYPHPEDDAFEQAQATRTQLYALCDELQGYLHDHIRHFSNA